jgi:hypothetical protein
MATKTKNELLKEIEAKNDEIQELKNEVKKLERFKQYEDMTDEMAALRDSFVNSGFSKSEAFELVKMLMSSTMKYAFR